MIEPGEEDVPLEVWVDRITWMIETNLARPDADEAEQRAVHAGYLGLLGETYLDLYARDGELEAAIGLLEEAHAAQPEHPDHVGWQASLLNAYGELAEQRDSLDDCQRAIDWGLRHLSDPALPEEDRGLATALLMDDLWRRHGLRPRQPETADTARDELVEALSALLIHDGTADCAAYTRLMTGMAHLERFAYTEQRSDLDRGLGLLADAVAILPPDAPRLVQAGWRLTYAYFTRYLEDDDTASRDLAIDTGEWAATLVQDDDDDSGMLWVELGRAYRSRWREEERPADLDRAVECWRKAWETNDPDGWIAACLGDCLRRRAERDENLTELQEAIELLRFAVEQDDELVSDYGCDLACAYHNSWQLAKTPGSLQLALEWFDSALAAGVPEGIDRVQAENNRAAAGNDLLKEDKSTLARQRRNLDAAFEALTGAAVMPEGAREVYAALLAFYHLAVWTVDADPDADVSRIRYLLDLSALPIDWFPEWKPMGEAFGSLITFVQQVGSTDTGADMGVGELARAMASPHLPDDMKSILKQALAAYSLVRGGRMGDLRAIRAAGHMMDALPSLQATDPQQLRMEVENAALMQLQRIGQELGTSGDMAQHRESIEEIGAALRHVWSSGPAEPALAQMLTMYEVFLGGPMPDSQSFGPIAGYTGKLAALPKLMQAHCGLVVALREQDPAAIRRSAAELVALIQLEEAYDITQMAALAMLAHAELTVAKLDTDPQAAGRAAALADDLLEMSGGPQHPLWTTWAMCRAEALRLMDPPDLAASRDIGLRALRAHALRVLAQSGTDYATESARTASANALTVARWCIDDGDLSAAMTALDAGRGLMLWSATASRQIADQLTAAGRADLASEWQQTQGIGRDQVTGQRLTDIEPGRDQVPDSLRQQVIGTLLATPDGPLDPVPPADVLSALSTLDIDALVYLVPGTGQASGIALIVEASGGLAALTLPGLRVDDDSPVTGRFAFGPDRDLLPLERGETADLDKLCRWAWSAAMADLVSHTAAWRLGRPARLVLVPMGALGRVPWHAAHDGNRFVVQDLVISYNVSARMLCLAATHPLREMRSALIVGDPTGNLPFAGIEARAVHQCFYPEGTYYGSGASRPGTPDEVLHWIASATSGASSLSFACHGWADPASPADTHLVLAGGTLAVRRILETSRLAALEIDRVFLAACTTNAGGDDHDEACSLAAAFLAAGAHTTFGSLWPVPDRSTSLLMFLVHHHLEVERRAPMDALHRAQLWMLDPNRQPPEGMPAELRAACRLPEVADPASWAAFTHLGR